MVTRALTKSLTPFVERCANCATSSSAKATGHRWNRVARLSAATPASNVAAALIEMAVLDRELRLCSRTLEQLWAPCGRTPRQTTYSLLDNGAEWVDDDVERVRLKTAPGQLQPADARTRGHVEGSGTARFQLFRAFRQRRPPSGATRSARSPRSVRSNSPSTSATSSTTRASPRDWTCRSASTKACARFATCPRSRATRPRAWCA